MEFKNLYVTQDVYTLFVITICVVTYFVHSSIPGYNFAVNFSIKKCIILHKCLDIQKKIYTFASNM